MTAMQQKVTLLPLHCNKTCKIILTCPAIHDTLYRKSHQICRKVQNGVDLFPMKIFTAPQHTRFILPPIHPTKFFACLAGRFFFYGTGTANLSISHDKEATRSMSYRDNLFLNARFKEAVQAAHDQDWQAFEKYSFYDARMMEDLLYKCEHLMPLEIKCRYALQHYYSHGDHSPIIRKYVRRAKIIRPDNWRDALPESVRNLDTFTIYRGGIGNIERAPLSISWSLSYDVAEWFAHRNELFYRCPCHVYQGTIHVDKVIAYLPERSEFEIIQHRNVKDVQEIAPLRGYSPPFNAFKSSKKWVHDEEESNRYFNEWYQTQNC